MGTCMANETDTGNNQAKTILVKGISTSVSNFRQNLK